MNRPPEIARWILSITNRKHNRESVLGDFDEFYGDIFEVRGKKEADKWYRGQALKSIPKFINSSFYWGVVMFNNYLKIAFRNIVKHKSFSSINVFGLAVGVASCLLILLWIGDELSYDKFNENSDRLYRVARVNENGKDERTPPELAPALKDEYPEIQNVSSYSVTPAYLKIDDRFFTDQQLAYVDTSFFNLFTFTFLRGDAASGIKDNSSIVLTEGCAQRLFGDNDPIGKAVKIKGTQDYLVTGVIKDVPHNSHMKFDCVVNCDSRDKTIERMFGKNSWRVNAYSTYVLLKTGTDVTNLNSKIKDIIKKHNERSESEIYLQAITDINLHPLEGEGNLKYLYIFSIIALFILLIACINFMNMSTARSSTRVKEIGIRKVIGAQKLSLVKQFLGESFILTLFSVFIALIIVVLLLPYFNEISGKQIELKSLLNLNAFGLLTLVTVVTTLLSGAYPAVYLSSLTPFAVLKKYIGTGSFAGRFRKYMVIVQFAISILLIIAVSVVYKQLSYMVNSDMGFNKEHMLYYTAPEEYIKNFESIRQELMSNPSIINATIGTPPMFLDFSVDEVLWDGKNDDKEVTFEIYHVGPDYVKTLGLKLLEGRDFSKNITSDFDDAYVINEEAAKVIGLPAINKRITFPGDFVKSSGKVIGIVKDFHQASFHEKIIPLVLQIDNDWTYNAIIRINSDNIPSMLKFLESEWNERVKDRPFEYTFFEDEIDNFYKKENQMAKLLGSFSVLAIIIACLGLLGLITFIGEQRRKEISIRKVLGSGVTGVVYMLTKEFVRWITIAGVFALPVGYFLMNKWLTGFAYRINISVWILILSAGIVLLISLATIAYQTIKAAVANPIEALKYE
jgi:putative ABC transport system permease protein